MKLNFKEFIKRIQSNKGLVTGILVGVSVLYLLALASGKKPPLTKEELAKIGKWTKKNWLPNPV